MSDLTPLFAPTAVAVLGVSRNPAKLGYRLLQNVKESGFRGAIHPVNPSGEPILGLDTVRTIEGLPDGVDLALVSLPAPAVPEAIEALAARRVRAAVILSSGFGEVDDDGRTTQGHLLATARAAGLRLVGPNCMGVYSAPVSLNGTYFWDLPRASGGISIVSQSGAYGGLIFRHLGGRGLGVARFVSIGNQADVEIAEVLDWLVDDPATTLIACFVEALRDGSRFLAAARRAAGRKPIVMLKGGRSDAGRRAAGSHTGSLAGAWEVYRAACASARVMLADETEEFFDAIEALVAIPERRPLARGVAVVTVSGGPSVVAADAAEREGLEVPAMSDGARAALRGLLPPFAAVGNPVDLTPQVEPARIAAAVRRVVDEPTIAGVIAVNVGLDIPQFAAGIVAAARETGKPAVAFTADAPEITTRFRAGGVPVLPSPERAVRAWRALWRARPPAPPVTLRPPSLLPESRRALDTTRGPLPYTLARRVLEDSGVRFCRETVATTPDDAAAAAESIGYPVVIKADAAGLAHKTDVGGVVLDVGDAAAVRAACATLGGRAGAARFVVQPRVSGVELLLGARRDEVFGPVIVVGAGGVLTEVARDVAVRLAALGEGEAEAMLEEGALPRLLAGPRGLPAVARAPLVAVIHAVAALILAEPRIVEIDVNPLIAAGAEVVAVDALVIAADH